MGFWGRGIYFALKSAYSYHYSFKPATTPDDPERPGGAQDEREMFLAKLLVGDVVMMNRDESDAKAAECKKLIVPPPNPVTGKKYNTVTGNTGGSQVDAPGWLPGCLAAWLPGWLPCLYVCLAARLRSSVAPSAVAASRWPMASYMVPRLCRCGSCMRTGARIRTILCATTRVAATTHAHHTGRSRRHKRS
jgi:hypothetical protein